MNSLGRVALVHDWLVTYRGGEQVLSALAEMFPDAPIYTLFHSPGQMPQSLNSHRIVTSYLDRIPGARDRHRWLLPLMPAAAGLLHVDKCDLLISSSHCVAKSVQAPKGAKHLSYVHAPLRYMWDRFDDYFGPGQSSAPVRWAARAIRPLMQRWDVSSSRGVDVFVANSHYVATQIFDRYQRTAQVIYPPIDLEDFASPDAIRQPVPDATLPGRSNNRRVHAGIVALAGFHGIFIDFPTKSSRMVINPLSSFATLLGRVAAGWLGRGPCPPSPSARWWASP